MFPSGKVEFAAGQTTSEPITVLVNADSQFETDESFRVTLANAGNATLDPAHTSADGVIRNDDQQLPPESEIIWQNGGNVNIGSAAATTVFNIGTNASGPTTGDRWTNEAGNRQWGTSGNWQDGSAPTSTDNVIFDVADSGGTNFVDRAFTINDLHYTAAAGHITDLSGGILLHVNGNASVGVANASNRGGLTILNTEVSATLSQLNIGFNSSRSGINVGSLRLDDAASLTVFTSEIVIGRVCRW